MTRSERQDKCLQKWVNTANRGTIEAFTGFGKTRIATNAIKLLRRNDATRKVVIVVPTIPLKKQWEKGLQSLNLENDSEVYVINSLIKIKRLECSMLILDEIHRYAAETFSKVFLVVEYSFILGLTATLKRLDKKHTILEQYAPVRDRVRLIEGKRNGWVAPFTEYNLGITLDEEDKESYRKMTREFSGYMDKFQGNPNKHAFEMMRMCSYSLNPSRRGSFYNNPPVVNYAMSRGWRGNSAERAFQIMMRNRTAARGQKDDMWGNPNHPYSPQKLYVYALQGMRLNRQIMDFCYNHPAKISTAEMLVKSFPDSKALTFCQTTDAADELKNRLGSMAEVYHSNMESVEEEVVKEKIYRTEQGADKWVEKYPEWEKRKYYSKWKVTITVTKKVSADKMRERTLERLIDTDQIRVVCTAKALDQGFDFPDCSLGVIYARTSSTTQQIQRTGRITRKHFREDGSEKTSVVVNIYLMDTKDYQWLNKCQKDSAGVRWVESIDEILEAENAYQEV